MSAGYFALRQYEINPLNPGTDNVMFGIDANSQGTTGSQNVGIGKSVYGPGNISITFTGDCERCVAMNGLGPINSGTINAVAVDTVAIGGLPLKTFATVPTVNTANVAVGHNSLRDSFGQPSDYNVAIGQAAGNGQNLVATQQTRNTLFGQQAFGGMRNADLLVNVGISTGGSVSVTNTDLIARSCAFGLQAGAITNDNAAVGATAGQSCGGTCVMLGNQANAVTAPTSALPTNAVGIGRNVRTLVSSSVAIGRQMIAAVTADPLLVIGSNCNFGNSSDPPMGRIVSVGHDNAIALTVGDHIQLGPVHKKFSATQDVISIGFGSIFEAASTSSQVYFYENVTSLKLSNAFQTSAASLSQLLMDGTGTVFRQASRRAAKEQIVDLEAKDTRALRPRAYKADGQQSFGLIAEEVEAAGFPELCTYDPDGVLTGVSYSMLAVHLLAELRAEEAKLRVLEQKVLGL